MPTNSPKTTYKIALLFDDSLDRPDGVQQYILTLGEWLRNQGHDVHYLTGQTIRNDIPNIHSLSRNIKVRFNGNGMAIPLPVSNRKVRKLLEQEKFDVVHVQAPFSPWLAGRVIKNIGQQTVLVGTFHILPQSKLVALASRALWLWTRRCWKRLDILLSVSPEAAKFARSIFRTKSTVVPNAFNYDLFADAPKPATVSKTVQLLFLGRLVPRKGIHLLLQTVAQMDKNLNFCLNIYGKGPLLPALTQYVEKYGLTDRVTFHGFVSEADKPAAYAAADIAVFPSTGGESFGIVLIEAMASGSAAVLAGNNPGYSSVLARPDLLFDPRDTKALARKLESLVRDPSARAHAATWCHQQAKQYDVQVVGDTISDTYHRLYQAKNMQ